MDTPKVGDTWYRYDATSYSVTVDADLDLYISSRKLECLTYVVEKITPKGVRLSNDKVVIRTTRKQFAHPTKRLALEAFVARKEKYVDILKHRVAQAEGDLADANVELARLP